MSAHEREPYPTDNPYVVDYEHYKGPSELIRGLQVLSHIEEPHSISFIHPYIVTKNLYEAYNRAGAEGAQQVQRALTPLWEKLKDSPVVVRRLFPDEEGIRQEGPRSGTITSSEEFVSSIVQFFEYFRDQYEQRPDKVVLPEIMVHRLIDANNPPREDGLPHPGGDVRPAGNNTFIIRSTWGADESVQGYPHDKIEISFKPDGGTVVKPLVIAQKTQAVVPDSDQDYRKVKIPKKYQERLSLDSLQAHALAEMCRRISLLNGTQPHRLEFNGTYDDQGKEIFFITEVERFVLDETPEDILQQFSKPHILSVITPISKEDFDTIESEDGIAYVHLPPQYFRRNERNDALTNLAIVAKEKGMRLIVFASGDDGNQHAVRTLRENGHGVIFIGEEEIQSGDKIRLFAKDGRLHWEHESPIVPQERMYGKSVDKIGGKATGLRELQEHGFPVPPLFTLESSVMRRLIEELGLEDEVKQLDKAQIHQVGTIAKKIRTRIRTSTGNLFDTFKEDFDREVENLPTELYIVRSTANYEDTEETSFAGYFETEEHVTKEGLRRAILNVIASTFTEDVMRTAKNRGIKPSQLKMAVIIQEEISGQTGSIFTKSLVAGEEGFMRINIKGEKQGILVNRKTEEVEMRGTLVSEEAIANIVDVAKRIKQTLGHGKQEMDVEFVLPKTGEVHSAEPVIVQARPLN